LQFSTGVQAETLDVSRGWTTETAFAMLDQWPITHGKQDHKCPFSEGIHLNVSAIEAICFTFTFNILHLFSCPYGDMTQGENALKRVFEQKQRKYRQLTQELSNL
jgi:hypothetical protein